MMTEHIDIAIPAYDSASVIEKTLDNVKRAFERAEIDCHRLIIDHKPSGDTTERLVRQWGARVDWEVDLMTTDHILPQARESLINRISTEWFLFLDDDVRVAPDYLQRLTGAVAPEVGAVQGRKESSLVPPSRWVKQRANRGGTHATLIRHESVSDLSIPSGLTVLEDEYIRQHVENNGYLWTFHHQARFDHANQDRHPMGWEEGWIAGYYDLKTPGEVIFQIPYEVATGGPLIPRLMRMGGFVQGLLQRELGR